MPTCKQKGCKIAEGGPCLEGLGTKCPHLIPDAPTDQPPSSQLAGTPGPAMERLYSGEKLNVSEASHILSNSGGQVVVLAGMKDSGKTTLLARVFEFFETGGVDDYLFAGSRTLPAYGLITWLATIESGATHPDTERTKHWENDTFLHLRVRHRSLSTPAVDLLFSDISGETFPKALANEERCKSLLSLARADHLVLVVDADNLSDFQNRQVHSNAARDFLKMALQTGSIGMHTIVHLVFSKWDTLDLKEDPTAHKQFVSSLQSKIECEFSTYFAKLSFWNVSARSANETPGEIRSLFKSWIEETRRLTFRKQADVVAVKDLSRDFSRFRNISS